MLRPGIVTHFGSALAVILYTGEEKTITMAERLHRLLFCLLLVQSTIPIGVISQSPPRTTAVNDNNKITKLLQPIPSAAEPIFIDITNDSQTNFTEKKQLHRGPVKIFFVKLNGEKTLFNVLPNATVEKNSHILRIPIQKPFLGK